jgi:hypothetical protein
MFLRCHEHSGAQIAAGATARHGTRGHCAHPSNFVSAVGWKSIGWSDQHAKTGRNGTLVSIRNSVRSCRSWTEDCENEIKSRVNPNTHLTSKNLDDPRCTEGRTTHVWLIFLQARLVTGDLTATQHSPPTRWLAACCTHASPFATTCWWTDMSSLQLRTNVFPTMTMLASKSNVLKNNSFKEMLMNYKASSYSHSSGLNRHTSRMVFSLLFDENWRLNTDSTYFQHLRLAFPKSRFLHQRGFASPGNAFENAPATPNRV